MKLGIKQQKSIKDLIETLWLLVNPLVPMVHTGKCKEKEINNLLIISQNYRYYEINGIQKDVLFFK